MKLEAFQRLSITFETLVVPPPFSHTYCFVLQPSDERLQVKYEISYTEREALTEEEILEEGFSLQDDYSWEGKLPLVWHQAVEKMLQQTTKLRKQPKAGSENVVILQIQDLKGTLHEGVPDNIEAWVYLLQEMTQAVFEISRKELPLLVKYLEISGTDHKLELFIQPSFSNRQLIAGVFEKGKKQEKSHPWERLKPLLKAVYLPDYDVSKSTSQQPATPGKYIDPGEGLWYALGKAVVNPGKKYDAIGAMEKEIKKLL